MSPIRYYLPDIMGICPYKPKVNPHYEVAAAENDAWVKRFDALSDPILAKSYRGANFCLLVALCFPDADRERLRLICDYTAGLFMWDDIIDFGDLQEDVVGTQMAGKSAMEALRDPVNVRANSVPAEMMREYVCEHEFGDFSL